MDRCWRTQNEDTIIIICLQTKQKSIRKADKRCVLQLGSEEMATGTLLPNSPSQFLPAGGALLIILQALFITPNRRFLEIIRTHKPGKMHFLRFKVGWW